MVARDYRGGEGVTTKGQYNRIFLAHQDGNDRHKTYSFVKALELRTTGVNFSVCKFKNKKMKKTITSHLHHQIQSLIHTCIHIHALPSDTQMDKPFFPASFVEQRQFIPTSLACRLRYIPLASLVLRTSNLN